MKEFEKWWDNLDTRSLSKEYSPFEEGWRAALEWIKDNDAEEIRRIVEEELRDYPC